MFFIDIPPVDKEVNVRLIASNMGNPTIMYSIIPIAVYIPNISSVFISVLVILGFILSSLASDSYSFDAALPFLINIPMNMITTPSQYIKIDNKRY